MKGKSSKRLNIYFRQTPRSFKSANQTSVFEHINKRVALINVFSKGVFRRYASKLKIKFNKFKK